MEVRGVSHVSDIGSFAIYVADVRDCAAAIDIAEVAPDPGFVARVRADRPALMIAVAAPTAEAATDCVRAGADLLVGDHLAETAATTGAGLICSDPELARSAGVPAERVLVDAGRSVARATELARGGHPVLVTPAGPRTDVATLTATTSVLAWLGAGVFRVEEQDAAAIRQALDMVASIKGVRQPTVSRRGLV